jgi:hypothetical protein
MAEPTEISVDAIKQSAVAPASISIDGSTVTERSISEQIQADRYAKATQAAARRNAFPFRRLRGRPPGSV